MTYFEVTTELIHAGVTTAQGIYEYEHFPNSNKFANYFTFCQDNLLKSEVDLDINPARIFYQDSYTVNGYAGRGNGYFVIMIPYGTLDILWTFFANKNPIFDDPERTEFRRLEPHLDSDLVALMFQMATLFTFYHEKAHLIQKSGDAAAFTFQEQYPANNVGVQYRLENHIYEFDADLNAAHFCVMHLLGYWDAIPQEERTIDRLRLLLVMGTSSIMIYFIFLLGINDRDIYYHDTLHPHPVIRISYIVDLMVKTMALNHVEIEQGLIIREATVLAESCYLLQGENRVMDFAGIFLRESINIEGYVNEFIAASVEYNNLAHLKHKDGV